MLQQAGRGSEEGLPGTSGIYPLQAKSVAKHKEIAQRMKANVYRTLITNRESEMRLFLHRRAQPATQRGVFWGRKDQAKGGKRSHTGTGGTAGVGRGLLKKGDLRKN